MTASVLCFASAKGGSGKTIITANIASFLTALGKKCLIIDCDAATHGMTLLYLVEVSKNPRKRKYGLFDLSSEDYSSTGSSGSIINVENGVDFLPATYNFKSGFDPEEKFQSNVLYKVVKKYRRIYDVILLDAQAGSDKYSRLAMDKNISDKIIIVSEYDPLSAAGIERLKQVVGDDLDYTRTWVLLNKMLPEFVDKFSEFLSITKYLPPIPWTADVVRAYAKRKLALDFEKGNVFTLSIMRTVSALFGDDLKVDINTWSNKRSYALRAPLNKQYVDAEKELQFTFKALREIRIKGTRRQLAKVYIVFGSIFAMLVLSKDLFNLIRSYLNPADPFVGSYLDLFEKFGGIPTIGIILALLPVLYLVTLGIFNDDNSTEKAKYERRISTLSEKLEQLESLKSADLETIIKNEKFS